MEQKKVMTVDQWNADAGKLRPSTEYWKPEPGIYKLKFLEEGQKQVKEFTRGEKTTRSERFSVRLLLDGKTETIFEVGTSEGYKAAYGQITLLAKENKGLTNLEVELTVVGEKTERTYVFREAQELIKADKEAKKVAIAGLQQENI